ncbi:hypothetical protein LOD99_9335 [Oopsacas minuta]|uniref:RAWUL domain-containing protein n=1 Tax=Oopsacas minuta TaxID=111878 RepID=A0AAV7JC58_9METZ|nr:hypothetical protein LOD99_9335 [Oopsacas minuta]
MCLEYEPMSTKSRSTKHVCYNLKKKYVCCSCKATVSQVKTFILTKLDLPEDTEIVLFCETEELVEASLSLEEICFTRWRYRVIPLMLSYRLPNAE